MFGKRLFILISLIAAICIILAGCGAGSNNSSDNAEEKSDQSKNEVKESLHVYSGAGLRKPMDDIGKLFEEKYGVRIDYSYAGSAQNLSQLEISGEGDVYVSGAKYYYQEAVDKDLVEYGKDVAYHIPVIGVSEGNPANIDSLEDLAKDGVKIVLGDESACAVGKLAQKILKENNIQKEVSKNVIAESPTVNELVVYLTMKQADASIVWRENVAGVKKVNFVNIDKEKNKIKTIPACVVSGSDKKELAKKFVDFVTNEEGEKIYKKHGFKPVY
ncbi:MAG: molybdate ABC transporter substrate-binding protein [Clostridiales bacterium]|nr:molybdate ABC transporter substrate-binding protein [Clostridiales bacterium]MCF8022051.1 molybdate ABC transporter substrate-binding protein [Clostridiales bacterium]